MASRARSVRNEACPHDLLRSGEGILRRRGQILDQRSLGARGWRFALVYLVLFLLTMIEPPTDWQPWFAIGVGLIAATGGFAWLRWDAHYQNRRLANGDYDRYDLL